MIIQFIIAIILICGIVFLMYLFLKRTKDYKDDKNTHTPITYDGARLGFVISIGGFLLITIMLMIKNYLDYGQIFFIH